jgi:hypothetical protein
MGSRPQSRPAISQPKMWSDATLLELAECPWLQFLAQLLAADYHAAAVNVAPHADDTMAGRPWVSEREAKQSRIRCLLRLSNPRLRCLERCH